jgi:hypothetical protein
MTRNLYYSIAAALALLLSTPLFAADVGVQVVFSDGEASIIRAYYRDHASPRNSGKTLPPGIAKKLQRGKPLPPGIAKQVLPRDLNGMLPPPPRGYERIVLDGKVLLIEIATRVIHDKLEDLVLKR